MRDIIISLIAILIFNSAVAQQKIDSVAKWEFGYDIVPNIKNWGSGSLIVKRYNGEGMNPIRFKVLLSSSNIDSQKTEGLADTSGYSDYHQYTIEGRLGKEWSKSLLASRAKVFWGLDIVYNINHDDATLFAASGVQRNSRDSNTFSYGASPFLGFSYAIGKGLAISVESHLDIYRTGIRRRINDPTLALREVKFKQNGFDINLKAIDVLYISLRF